MAVTDWVSLFRNGACTVTVQPADSGSPIWTGSLGLGDSSATFEVNAGTGQVSVSSEGVLTFLTPDDSVSDAHGLQLSVTPTVDDAVLPLRSLDIIGNISANPDSTGGQAGNSIAADTALTFNAETMAATPSEADFDADDSGDAVLFVYVGGVG